MTKEEILRSIVNSTPYAKFLGIQYDLRGDELTTIMKADPKIVGNPMGNRTHGGATAGFLEFTAILQVSWALICEGTGEKDFEPNMPILPKTINMTVDYLSPGKMQDHYARARINRLGRRYASVHVEGWQDNRDKIFAQATGHFLLNRNS